MTGHAPDYAMLMVRKQVLFFLIQYFISDLGWCQCWCNWYDKRTSCKEIKIRKNDYYFFILIYRDWLLHSVYLFLLL
jgi:hypothetical protein